MEPFAFLSRLRATVPGSRTAVLVWASEELTGPRRAQLDAAAQAVVVKGQGHREGGTQALLEELQAWLAGAGGQAGNRHTRRHSGSGAGAPTEGEGR